MKRVGIIGTGKIGRPVAKAIRGPLSDRYALAGTLTSSGDAEAFFAHKPDLIIEAGGAGAVAQWGERAISEADFWIVSAVALIDSELRETLAATARATGHRICVMTGAIAGLDGVRTASVDPEATLKVSVCVAPTGKRRTVLFSGTADEAAKRFPDSVNVAVAAALAGPGLQKTHVEVIEPAEGEAREMHFDVRSRFGDFTATSRPKVKPPQGIHTVAANIISALSNEARELKIG